MGHSTTSSAGIPPALENFDRLPDSAYVALPIVKAVSGAGSDATVWRWAKAGRLPAPEKIGPNSTRWNVGKLRRAMLALTAPRAAA